jgi:hypothetical protein
MQGRRCRPATRNFRRCSLSPTWWPWRRLARQGQPRGAVVRRHVASRDGDGVGSSGATRSVLFKWGSKNMALRLVERLRRVTLRRAGPGRPRRAKANG